MAANAAASRSARAERHFDIERESQPVSHAPDLFLASRAFRFAAAFS